MLNTLLFPRSPLLPIDRESGTPATVPSVLLHHYYGYYRSAIQDALHRSRRKPFQCGGLQGYDQLVGMVAHVEQRREMYGPDPYLNALETHLRGAIAVARTQAEDVRQAHTFLR